MTSSSHDNDAESLAPTIQPTPEEEEQEVHYQRYTISQLPTRSVTIYPTRAAVVRELPNLQIQPGRTELTIVNITPQADEHSIKVEGHGTAAVIVDMTIDRVPNRALDDDDDDDEDDSENEDEGEVENHPPELKECIKEISDLARKKADKEHSMSTFGAQLEFLEERMTHVVNSDKTGNLNEVANMLSTYSSTRENLYTACQNLRDEVKVVAKNLEKAQRRRTRLLALYEKSRWPARLAREDRRREHREQRLERPADVLRLRITLECGTLSADDESRATKAEISRGRPEQDGDELPPAGSNGSWLRLSYITSGASWTPHYDLRLDTTKRTGSLTYRANFQNRTNEAWTNAAISLSTSQNSFGGLGDTPPWLSPWPVTTSKHDSDQDGAFMSLAEKTAVATSLTVGSATTIPLANADKGSIYSYPPLPMNYRNVLRPQANLPEIPEMPLQFQTTRNSMHRRRSFSDSPSSHPRTRNAMSRAQMVQPYAGPHMQDFDSVSCMVGASASALSAQTAPVEESVDHSGLPLFRREPYRESRGHSAKKSMLSPPTPTPAAASGPLRMATSAAAAHGSTTVFPLPGRRTVTASTLTRRHILSELILDTVSFTHVCVPKLRTAVFLKASTRLPASAAGLLPGPAGLTLDGTFLGTTAIDRTAPGDPVSVNLGIDEAITVSYDRPVNCKFTESSFLSREHCRGYRRVAHVHSSRPGRARLVVFDQVPSAPEGAQVAISIVRPQGLAKEGDVSSVTEEVVARRGRDGEVKWIVALERPGDVVLELEYQVRLSNGLWVVNAK